MTNSTNHVFANTCGKIFRNHLILTVNKKESRFLYHEIKSISFSRRRKKADLLVALLPAVLFVFAYLLKKDETLLRGLFIALGILGIALSLFKARAGYMVTVKINGNSKALLLKAANKREAEKFTAQANSILQKYRLKMQPETVTGLQGIMPVASL